jgi:hypothetical protein
VIAKALKAHGGDRRRFDKLVRYIGHEDKGELLVAQNVADPSTAAAEMEAIAALSPRTKDPVYHFTISWSPEEEVTEDQMRQALDKALAALGLDEHQVLASLHVNTDHPHLHAVVNRVHPTTYKAQSMWRDWTRLDRIVEELAIANQWKISTPRETIDPTLGRGATLGPAWGKPTFSGWLNAQLRLRVANLLASGTATWESFHDLVGTFGARYERATRGAIFADAGRVDTVAGASRVMRMCSLPTLERVLGPYRPATSEPVVAKAYSRQQFTEPPGQLREKYAADLDERRRLQRSDHRDTLQRIRDDEQAARQEARQRFREREKIAKGFSPEIRRALLNAARHTRNVAYNVSRHVARDARRLLGRPTPVPDFTAWLYEQVRDGNDMAITFIAEHRQRRRVMHLPLPELGHPELLGRVLQTVQPQPETPRISGPSYPHGISEP